MPVGGKIREPKEWSKQTGFFEATIVGVNPDREALEKLLGTTLEKDPEYLGEDEKSVTKLNLVFWLKDEVTGAIRSVRFFLKDTEKLNQDKTKKQYVNSIGSTSWADAKEHLPDWFIKREYRIAHEGEAELYAFASSWLGKVDYNDKEATLSFDWAKLMRGNVKELASQIGGEYATTTVFLNTVKVVEKDGEMKEFEQVYNRDFLPGYLMKTIRLKKIDTKFIDLAKATERNKRSKLQKFVLQVTDSEHGIKDYFTLGELENYDPAKNIATSNTSHIKEDDTSY